MVGMPHAPSLGQGRPSIGTLLQYWRRARSLSQLALAHDANVSPRHLCFLETGRAKPSRDSTPQDITLQELRVECFFPMDDATAAAAHRLQSGRPTRDEAGEIVRSRDPSVECPPKHLPR